MRIREKSSDQIDGAADAFASHDPSGVRRRGTGPRLALFAVSVSRAGTAYGMDIFHLVDISSTRRWVVFRHKESQIPSSKRSHQ
jgi:hypothetical protein